MFEIIGYGFSAAFMSVLMCGWVFLAILLICNHFAYQILRETDILVGNCNEISGSRYFYSRYFFKPEHRYKHRFSFFVLKKFKFLKRLGCNDTEDLYGHTFVLAVLCLFVNAVFFAILGHNEMFIEGGYVANAINGINIFSSAAGWFFSWVFIVATPYYLFIWLGRKAISWTSNLKITIDKNEYK